MELPTEGLERSGVLEQEEAGSGGARLYAAFREKYEAVSAALEMYIPALTVLFFIMGVFGAKLYPAFGAWITRLVSAFIDGYGYVAPLAIFLIFTPSLAKLLRFRAAGRFGAFAIGWLGTRRLLACVWGAIFTALIFRYPLFPSHHTNCLVSMEASLKSFLWMVTHSTYFYALYLGVAVGYLSVKRDKLYNFLDNTLNTIENIGEYFELTIPLFMMAVGAFVYTLPSTINSQINMNDLGLAAGRVNLIGFHIDPHTPGDFILIYVLGALLVGAACFMWHSLLLGLVRYKVKDFSIRKYFLKYWIRVYPLLWATSSEALATPLNLYLTKTHYPQIKDEVRRLAVGMGSYLNINGTLICVFVLLGVVANTLGFKLSLLELLFCVPIVFLIGYGVPGIPGELILFAGPIATLLNLPADVAPAFLALYCGLQLGLPDSFRSGNNSTDNLLCALLLNDIYEKKFLCEKGESNELENGTMAGIPGRAHKQGDEGLGAPAGKQRLRLPAGVP